MKCKLCGKDKKLVDAHIIPYWAYKYISREDPIVQPLLILSKNRDKKSPKGLYNKNILCSECDNFLGDFDNYGKKLFVDETLESISSKEEELAYYIRDINYKNLQIFVMSVLWRASISDNEELANVDLGPYDERIHKILLKVKIGKNVDKDLEDYPVIVTKFESEKFPEIVDKSISLPRTIHKINGVNFAILYLPKGFKIYLKTDKRRIPTIMNIKYLYDKDLVVLKQKDLEDSADFRNLLDSIKIPEKK